MSLLPILLLLYFFQLKKKGKRIDFFITGQPTWQRLSCHMAHFYTDFDLMCIACLSEANVKMTIVSHFWAIARRTLTHSFMVISGYFKSFSNSTIHIKQNKARTFFLSFPKLFFFWFLNLHQLFLKINQQLKGEQRNIYSFTLSSVLSQERFTTGIKPFSASGFWSWAAILSIYYFPHKLISIHTYKIQ